VRRSGRVGGVAVGLGVREVLAWLAGCPRGMRWDAFLCMNTWIDALRYGRWRLKSGVRARAHTHTHNPHLYNIEPSFYERVETSPPTQKNQKKTTATNISIRTEYFFFFFCARGKLLP